MAQYDGFSTGKRAAGRGVRESADSNEPADGEEVGRWQQLGNFQASGWFWSATVAVGVLLLVVAVAGVKGWADLRSSQARVDALAAEVREADQSVRRLKKRIHLLQSNSELLERVAREELGVVQPDEVVVILP